MLGHLIQRVLLRCAASLCSYATLCSAFFGNLHSLLCPFHAGSQPLSAHSSCLLCLLSENERCLSYERKPVGELTPAHLRARTVRSRRV